MAVQIKLTDEEVIEAIFEYVDSKYPTMYSEKATLHYSRGRLKEATVDCKLKNKLNQDNSWNICFKLKGVNRVNEKDEKILNLLENIVSCIGCIHDDTLSSSDVSRIDRKSVV